ncbi:unnamed protein product [Parascedosporium putredinis]|uniref:ATP-dependent DNA helicase II subunit 1 n=1 Tax=Parascedosporium putredinis TaxID=1442378 RepID=A0A9P1GUZ8_9PEZI|nr:unnamed protein product [Parascedosporium putredinis]CAI7987828.1 unnamed protein product [Parascedosporium putredinis]
MTLRCVHPKARFQIDAECSVQQRNYDEEAAEEEVDEARIISNPKDMMGVLLFGTEKAKFQNEGDDKHAPVYPHCYLFTDLDIPSAEDVKSLKSLVEDDNDEDNILVPSKDPAAMANVLFCANQIFTTKAANFGSRRLFVLTDNDNPHSADKQAKSAAAVRAKDLYDLGVVIELFPITREERDFDMGKFYDDIMYRDSAAEANMSDVLTSKSGGGLSLLNSLIANINSKQTAKRALFSGVAFEIAPGLTISVKGKVGDKKAYKFGGEYVYFTPEEQKSLKDFGPSTIRILGFKPQSSLPFWASVHKSSFIFPSEEHYVGSTRVFTALWKKLLADDKMAIAWAITRSNAKPTLVAIIPSRGRSEEDSGPQSLPAGLWLYPLPFVDDIRNPPDMPDPVQASDALVDKMQIIAENLWLPNRAYNPSKYPNPQLQWHYKILQALALQEEVPETPEDLTVPKYNAIAKRVGGHIRDWQALVDEELSHVRKQGSLKREAGDEEGGKPKKRTKAESKPAGSGLSDAQIKAANDSGGLSKMTVAELKDPSRIILASETIMNQPQDDPVLQKDVARYIAGVVGSCDGSAWVLREMSRKPQGWIFIYVCKQSMQVWLRRNAQSVGNIVVGDYSSKELDAVSASERQMEGDAAQETPDAEIIVGSAEMVGDPALPKRSKKATPRRKKKAAEKPEEPAPAASQANDSEQASADDAPTAAVLAPLLNLDPAEAERRSQRAVELLQGAGLDPSTLSSDQFNIFANQSPGLQQESLAMLVRYGAERLRIIHPNKEAPAQDSENVAPCGREKPTCQNCLDAGEECVYPLQKTRPKKPKSNTLVSEDVDAEGEASEVMDYSPGPEDQDHSLGPGVPEAELQDTVEDAPPHDYFASTHNHNPPAAEPANTSEEGPYPLSVTHHLEPPENSNPPDVVVSAPTNAAETTQASKRRSLPSGPANRKKANDAIPLALPESPMMSAWGTMTISPSSLSNATDSHPQPTSSTPSSDVSQPFQHPQQTAVATQAALQEPWNPSTSSAQPTQSRQSPFQAPAPAPPARAKSRAQSRTLARREGRPLFSAVSSSNGDTSHPRQLRGCRAENSQSSNRVTYEPYSSHPAGLRANPPYTPYEDYGRSATPAATAGATSSAQSRTSSYSTSVHNTTITTSSSTPGTYSYPSSQARDAQGGNNANTHRYQNKQQQQQQNWYGYPSSSSSNTQPTRGSYGSYDHHGSLTLPNHGSSYGGADNDALIDLLAGSVHHRQ